MLESKNPKAVQRPAEIEPEAPRPRVIDEFRGTPAVVPVRLSDFPREKELGWHRYKVRAEVRASLRGAVPDRAAWPHSYVLAATAADAEQAYMDFHEISRMSADEVKRLVFITRVMPD